MLHHSRSPIVRAFRIAIGFVLLAVTAQSRTAAQQLRPVSFEVNVGASFGNSSVPHGPSRGLSADALVGFRTGSAPGGFVLALSGSGQAPGVHVASCDAVPGFPCESDFPVFWIVSALAGWETRNAGAR